MTEAVSFDTGAAVFRAKKTEMKCVTADIYKNIISAEKYSHEYSVMRQITVELGLMRDIIYP